MMKITSLNGLNNATSEVVLVLELAQDIIINYGCRGISIVGIFVNLFGLIVLRNRHLEEKFYDCLFCRCVCNLVVCLFGCLHNVLPCKMCPTYFVWLFLKLYVHMLGMRIAFFASVICDILLILNRMLLLLDRKNSVLYKLSKKVIYYFMSQLVE